MNWHTMFQPHILDRGIEYYEDGAVTEFEISSDGYEINAVVEGTEDYNVQIHVRGDVVESMECDCPYAESGNKCKHMAAVLFVYEDYLSENDCEDDEEEYGSKTVVSSWEERFDRQKKEIIDLVNTIPEDKLRKLMVNQLLNNESLRNQLALEYGTGCDASQMKRLESEIKEIHYRNSDHRGFVDWRQASNFTNELCAFLNDKVRKLEERGFILQAFELTNRVFEMIGNVDMDDSDGGYSYVADECYEFWKLIYKKASENDKEYIKKWFESHQDGYVIDYMEEYLQEFLFEEIGSEDYIRQEILELDEIIKNMESDQARHGIYSVHYGYQNPVLKRIEYMKKLNCTDKEINAYMSEHRQFYVIREMEISDAIEKNDFKKAEAILLESRELDQKYPEQLKKYSKILIELYEKTGNIDLLKDELISQITAYLQNDLEYVLQLKKAVKDAKEWETLINLFIEKAKSKEFKCKLLASENRLAELLAIILDNNGIFLMEQYETILKKNYSEKIIAFYSEYVLKEADRVSDRNGYKRLMVYLKKIFSCENGKSAAIQIADQWRIQYKRRPAMMDEMRKAGF
ncbi:MAG: SWIM zinc finger family protein [Blautia sp.]|nr:SWIM zinc finger family protein [Blautia sp.]MDY3998559.1 SWIM zinc finger family protein [Blautia sp.]